MNHINDLKNFIEKSVTPFHTVLAAEKILKKFGFKPLPACGKWNLIKGRYYIKTCDSALFAFTIGDVKNGMPFRVAAAHTDFPSIHIKPNPDINTIGYKKLNTEIYGGAILNTWLDRPLSIAGRVALKGKDVFHPEVRFADFKKPVAYIPNLAIHLNRSINKGVELNRQKDMLPIIGLCENEKTFMTYFAEFLKVTEKDILDFELSLYLAEEGSFTGFDNEFYTSARLDDLTSVKICIDAICSSFSESSINMIALFDNEEVGSRSKQGADSNLLYMIAEKICQSLEINLFDSLKESIMLSLDVAQGAHPNYIEKYDITNIPSLGGGFCIKQACSQSYATDCLASAVIEQLCEKEDIKYQKCVNRSDIIGGSTIGSIISSVLPIKTVDMGIPLLAMHSAREMMCAKDFESLHKLMALYFDYS
ncbi:MAG: M18 family aminopeptidase [Clostridia bacterium]|jgi:aspartyl aminopeptidase|nr:M18 family aminopeptidase [Clostridia bacterium]MCI1999336.1 M18 family aminopeptidase [Clostridia bacterium]MCI2015162.1 M18 family aminopeptidase [Clostridia bacterium]